MDYFVELAGTTDVLEAIQRDKRLDHSQEADDLLLYDFLREEHPSAWTAEVVHAFYKAPAFAVRVWRNLRYCDGWLLTLAEGVLRDDSRWIHKARLAAVDPVSQQFQSQFATAPVAAVKGYAATLRDRPLTVDELCKQSGLHPEPPAFLRTLMMTVFNVRLGWWVRNPRRNDGVVKPSPRLGLPYTALELFGGTDDRKRYVKLIPRCERASLSRRDQRSRVPSSGSSTCAQIFWHRTRASSRMPISIGPPSSGSPWFPGPSTTTPSSSGF
jgi:hypothetical protein